MNSCSLTLAKLPVLLKHCFLIDLKLTPIMLSQSFFFFFHCSQALIPSFSHCQPMISVSSTLFIGNGTVLPNHPGRNLLGIFDLFLSLTLIFQPRFAPFLCLMPLISVFLLSNCPCPVSYFFIFII